MMYGQRLAAFDAGGGCPQCGSTLTSTDCWSCGGSGGEYPYDDDPIEYGPHEFKACQECGGRGYIVVCLGEHATPSSQEMNE